MLFLAASALALPLVSALFLGVVGLTTLFDRDEITPDVCGEVNGKLAVTNPWNPSTTMVMGSVNACICISTLPSFIATNPVAVSASALAGKAAAISALTTLIKTSRGHQTCQYPPHSIPACQHGNPCGFTCKNGYIPFPAYGKPTKCICPYPLTECNGKCGKFHGCPSGHAKRDIVYGSDKQCPRGLMACGVVSRNAKSWECIDTQNDLESCGGCIIPLHSKLSSPEGEDCTAIPGVSDVSCIRGGCVVHRCMPGYGISNTGSFCVYAGDKNPVVLAAQYGLEHVPV